MRFIFKRSLLNFFGIVLIAGLLGIMFINMGTYTRAVTFIDSPNLGISSKDPSVQFAKGRILLMPRAGMPAQALEKLIKENRGKSHKVGQSEIFIIDVPENTEEQVVDALSKNPHIKFAVLDRVITPAFIPNDPYYASLGNAWHLSKIGATKAWDMTQGAGVKIAILDTGVDSNHPDLAANIIPGWNFWYNTADTSDVHGHGTGVAGSSAAITNNGYGVASVAGQAKIMPMRVTQDDGTYSLDSVVVQSLTYAADRGVRVANMSFGGLSGSPALRSAAQYMKDKGGLVVVSAGNSSSLESFPTTTTMIPVGATDENDAKAGFSSYGDFVAIAAPGKSIYTTWKGGQYWSVAGTSFSAPVVAGVIALMMSANPQLSSTEIENLLYSTAVDLGSDGRDIYFGYGRVDAAAAVNAAAMAAPTADTIIPTVAITNPASGSTVGGLVPIDITSNDNIGVVRVELSVNNYSVAMDSSQPFAFTWDSTSVANGNANIMVKAYDAAGNFSSSSISVNVSNVISPPHVDTEAPILTIVNPVSGTVTGTVAININATDDSPTSEITLSLYIDNKLKISAMGGSLAYNWSTNRGVKLGSHTIKAIAKDKAGYISTKTVTVNVVK